MTPPPKPKKKIPPSKAEQVACSQPEIIFPKIEKIIEAKKRLKEKNQGD